MDKVQQIDYIEMPLKDLRKTSLILWNKLKAIKVIGPKFHQIANG